VSWTPPPVPPPGPPLQPSRKPRSKGVTVALAVVGVAVLLCCCGGPLGASGAFVRLESGPYASVSGVCAGITSPELQAVLKTWRQQSSVVPVGGSDEGDCAWLSPENERGQASRLSVRVALYDRRPFKGSVDVAKDLYQFALGLHDRSDARPPVEPIGDEATLFLSDAGVSVTQEAVARYDNAVVNVSLSLVRPGPARLAEPERDAAYMNIEHLTRLLADDVVDSLRG
jgi:hypothetical protein